MSASQYTYRKSSELLFFDHRDAKQQQPSWSAHQPPTSIVPLYDLQDVIQQYQSQPELLKLILTSKVEEDKRRAEEAKLRAKELDIYLHHRHSTGSRSTSSDSPPTTPRLSKSNLSIKEDAHDPIYDNDHMKKKRKSSPTSSDTLTEDHCSSSFIAHAADKSIKNQKAASSRSLSFADMTLQERITSHNGQCYNSRPFPSFSISSTSSLSSLSEIEEEREETVTVAEEDYEKRRESAAVAMLVMGGNEVEADMTPGILSATTDTPNAVPRTEAATKQWKCNSNDKTRRRREMQAITKIVETREFPYIDNYFWKNNGNTVQKKTGCKSIYYKCSNSNKGCTVNKTVTARVNGEYLIKYRGEHLPECGKVERIRDL